MDDITTHNPVENLPAPLHGDSRAAPSADMTDQEKLRAERKRVFCEVLAETGNRTKAARAATPGCGPDARPPVKTFDRWQKTDLAFAAAVDSALLSFGEVVRDVIKRRAIDGIEEVVVQAGRIVKDDDGRPVTKINYSDRLLLAYAKSILPEFNDDKRHLHLHVGPDGQPLGDDFTKYCGTSRWYLTRLDLTFLTREQAQQLDSIMAHLHRKRKEFLQDGLELTRFDLPEPDSIAAFKMIEEGDVIDVEPESLGYAESTEVMDNG